MVERKGTQIRHLSRGEVSAAPQLLSRERFGTAIHRGPGSAEARAFPAGIRGKAGPRPTLLRACRCAGAVALAVTSTRDAALLPTPISTMRCRFGMTEALRCVVGSQLGKPSCS